MATDGGMGLQVESMRSRVTLPFAFLGVGFAGISFILIAVEPGMGFHSFADYLDPQKVIPQAGSAAWLVGDLLYLGFAVALAALALESGDRLARASAFAAATLFLLVTALDRVLAVLPGAIPEPVHLEAAVLGLVSTRFGVLKVTVLTLAVLAWRTTSGAARIWRVLAALLLVAAAAFLFVFLPVPLLFAAWFSAWAVRSARA